MTLIKLIALSLAALLGASALPAVAQTADEQPAPVDQADQAQMSDRGHGDRGHGDGRHHGGKRGHGPRQMIIDVNGDGVIGDDEAASLADRAYMRIDRDGSGDISVEEFSTVRKGRGGWFGWGAQGEAVTEGLKAKFATLDADKDGKLTRAEFMGDAKARFAAADADKDGKVNPWEFRSQQN